MPERRAALAERDAQRATFAAAEMTSLILAVQTSEPTVFALPRCAGDNLTDWNAFLGRYRAEWFLWLGRVRIRRRVSCGSLSVLNHAKQ